MLPCLIRSAETTGMKHVLSHAIWGTPAFKTTTTATAVTSPAATETRGRGHRRHGAPNPAILSSFDAVYHREDVRHDLGCVCFTDARRRRPRRRGTSATM